MKVSKLVEILLNKNQDARVLIEDMDGQDFDVEAVDSDNLDGEKVVVIIPGDA
jgi:hypothetical protein